MYLHRHIFGLLVLLPCLLFSQDDLLSILGDKDSKVSADKIAEFDVKFRKGAHVARTVDIARTLKYNIPSNYVVTKVNLVAYSSMEGDSVLNQGLRLQRIDNILACLKRILNTDFDVQKDNKDSWLLFKKDIKRQKSFKFLSAWTKDQVYNYLQSESNKLELEPILKHHRFVSVKLTMEESDRNQPMNINPAPVPEVKNTSLPITKTSIKEINKTIYVQSTPELQKEDLDSFFQDIMDVLDIRLTNIENKINDVSENVKSKSTETAFKKAPKEQIFRTKRNYIEEKLAEIDKTPNGDFMDRIGLIKRLANINEFYLSDSTNIYYEEIKKLYQIDEMSSDEGLKVAQLAMKNKDYKYAYKVMDNYVLEENTNVEYLLSMIYCANALEFKGNIAKDMKYVFKKLWKSYPESFCALFLDKQLNMLHVYTNKMSAKKCKLCHGYGFKCD